MVIRDEIVECQHDPVETTEAIVCRNCGMVLDQIYEQTLNYQRKVSISYKKYEDNSGFIRQNESLHLPFEIGCRTVFDGWKSLKNKELYKRLQWQNQFNLKQYSGSYLARMFVPKINGIVEKYGFPQIIQEEVTRNFKKLQRLGVLKGRSGMAIMYVLFHIFCRLHYSSHSAIEGESELVEAISPFFNLRTIAELEGFPLRLLHRTFFRVMDVLKINFTRQLSENETVSLSKVEQIANAKNILLRRVINTVIQYLIEKYKINENIREKIIPYIPLMEEIYQAHEVWKMKDPSWVVCGFIYLFQQKLTDRKIVQKEIGYAVNKSELTIRSYMKQVKYAMVKLGKEVN